MKLDTIIMDSLGDKYEILSVIGKGGMATVYKAIQKSLNRPVALKVIHQNLVHDEEFVKRFIREAQVCASLRHPNIITIYDVGSVDTVHYIAMDYLEGLNLRDIIQQKESLRLEETLRYIVPLAGALDYMHQKEVIHRDVKSSNIFITGNGQPILMDFGIVFSGSHSALSQAGVILGTPEYMSPEQAEGKIKIDGRSDIYSLGVVMFECLTGKLPFHSDNYLSTLVQVIHDTPPLVNSIDPSVPEWISDIVSCCLIKDRTLRISDGITLAADLRNQKASEFIHISSSASRTSEQVTKRIEVGNNKLVLDSESNDYINKSRSKRISILGALFVILLVILAVLVIFVLGPSKNQSISGKALQKKELISTEKLKSVATVTTSLITNINTRNAICGGNVASNGGPPIKLRGVCWGTSNHPTISDNKTSDGEEEGSFISKLTGLSSNTLYFVRAYLTDSYSTIYGEELSFTTPSNVVQQKKYIQPVAETEEVPYVVVEEKPMFPGGDVELLKFIGTHTNYPTGAKENDIQGRVIVRFCITAKGGVSQVSVLKGVDPELDKEAIRVVNILPAFKPGKQGGKPVPVWYMVPITFSLK